MTYKIISKNRFGSTITLTVEYSFDSGVVKTEDIPCPLEVNIDDAIKNRAMSILNELEKAEQSKVVLETIVLLEEKTLIL